MFVKLRKFAFFLFLCIKKELKDFIIYKIIKHNKVYRYIIAFFYDSLMIFFFFLSIFLL